MVTVSGIFKTVRELQEENALFPILVTELDIVRLTRVVQELNAPLPITELRILTEVKE